MQLASEDHARIQAVIPAHNEADCITATIRSLLDQTRQPDEITVVCDNCTDHTESISRQSRVDVFRTTDNKNKKAGALNQFLLDRVPHLGPNDRVLIMDADTILNPKWIENACAQLDGDGSTGAVAATFRGIGESNISMLQRLEYERFARTTARRGARPQVLTGTATIFEADVLREIPVARISGRLPGFPGDIYDRNSLTEDMEITLATLSLGYRPKSPKGCLAWTETMDTWDKLTQQRLRWYRGLLDALRLHGFKRATMRYMALATSIYVSLLLTPLYLLLLTTSIAITGTLHANPIWFSVLAVLTVERVVTGWPQGWRGRILSALIVPEMAYEFYRGFLYWRALGQHLRKTETVWVAT